MRALRRPCCLNRFCRTCAGTGVRVDLVGRRSAARPRRRRTPTARAGMGCLRTRERYRLEALVARLGVEAIALRMGTDPRGLLRLRRGVPVALYVVARVRGRI